MKEKDKIPESIHSAGKKLPFEVPESYFQEFPGRLEKRLLEKKPVAKVRSLRPVLAVAAIFIGLLALGYAGFRIMINSDDPSYFTDQELLEAIEYFAYEVDEDMLVSAIVESDISLNGESPDSYTEEIIQYLSEDDIDFSNLMNDY